MSIYLNEWLTTFTLWKKKRFKVFHLLPSSVPIFEATTISSAFTFRWDFLEDDLVNDFFLDAFVGAVVIFTLWWSLTTSIFNDDEDEASGRPPPTDIDESLRPSVKNANDDDTICENRFRDEAFTRLRDIVDDLSSKF